MDDFINLMQPLDVASQVNTHDIFSRHVLRITMMIHQNIKSSIAPLAPAKYQYPFALAYLHD